MLKISLKNTIAYEIQNQKKYHQKKEVYVLVITSQ